MTIQTKILKVRRYNLTETQIKTIKVIGSQIQITYFNWLFNQLFLTKILNYFFFSYYLLYRKKELIGFCACLKNQIRSFAIAKSCQRQGYGRILVNYVLKDLKKQGYSRIKAHPTGNSYGFWKRFNKVYVSSITLCFLT